MEAIKKVVSPTKEQVREYMEARMHSRQAPDSGEEIRRQLGWKMSVSERVSFDR